MPTVPQDRRVKVTRDKLRTALIEICRKKAPGDVTVRELCTKAGVSRSAFYAHYSNPISIVEETERELYEEFSHTLEQKRYASSNEGLFPRLIFLDTFSLLAHNRAACDLLLCEHGDHTFLLRLINLGREKIFSWNDNTHWSEQELDYLYSFVCAGLFGLVLQWFRQGMRETPQEMANLAEKISSSAFQSLRDGDF